ncbi:MAG: tRNA pseudouridine(38-40) synthase TruA [Actinomycetota bacterium]|nr:tRNA pseudouridine(38-40) synthase TruA [Actinomycetota bacterium]
MVRYMVELEYKGSLFHGFQKQPNVRTVQGSLEESLAVMTAREVSVSGAGRTDAGVHAIGQIVAFALEDEIQEERFMRGVNALLPNGVAITSIRRVRDDFDPRRDAIWREYRYFILNRESPSPLLEDFSFHYSRNLDFEKMSEACLLSLGKHDFSAFMIGKATGSTEKNILVCELERAPLDLLTIRVRADSFLYRMVRILAGAFLEVGSGGMGLDEFCDKLSGGEEPCADPLPPSGLFLWEIGYSEEGGHL